MTDAGRSRVALCTAISAAATLGLMGCSAHRAGSDPTGDSPGAVATVDAQSSGLDLTAELDEESGAVILPYDRLTTTWAEGDLITTGTSIAISRCAEAKGVTLVASPPIDDPVYASEQYFGPWTVDQARRFGFVMPMSDADLVANGVVTASPDATPFVAPNGDLTDADWAVVDACASSPEVKALTDSIDDGGPWIEAIAATHDQLLEDEQARAIIKDLQGCFQSSGLTWDDSNEPWIPLGADGSQISEDQITLALQLVDCKEQVDFTSRMAAREAELQAPVIEKYADELVAQRQASDDVVAAARVLVAGYAPFAEQTS